MRVPTKEPRSRSRLSHADERIALFLVDWIDAVRRRARGVVWGTLVLTLGLAVFTAHRLGIDSDNLSLIDPDLPFMVSQREFAEHFPVLDNALLVVVDARTPELARESADALRARLALRTEYFEEYVMEPLAERMLAEDPDLRREFEAALAADEELASDPRRRLDWLYRRTPYFDERWNLYPVGREK